AKLAAYIEELPEDIKEPYTTEVNLGVKAWINDVAQVISKGFVMTIDYGYTRKEYFAPFRNMGTLLAYRGQTVHEDLLARPGEQDLTAHVNFSDLARWGKEAGFSTIGYAPQWAFLGGLDFEDVVRGIIGSDFEPFSPKLAMIKSLILPQGMGSTHKVMVQAKGLETIPTLKGFKIKNFAGRL
nr:SAM-dependent methyltransferase [Desulfobacteraceae bacterium]